MRRIETTQVRREFAETVNEVAYGKERVILQRRGRDIAAIVPLDDLWHLEPLARKVREEKPAAVEARPPNVIRLSSKRRP